MKCQFQTDDVYKSSEERKCTKFNHIQEQISNDAQIEVIEFDELMNRLDINNENLAMARDVDYKYLLDNKYGIRNLSKKNETKIALF